MSFFTPSTPFTLRATSIALLISACELTKPLNWTVPLKVSTLISVALKAGSLIMAALTLVVITLSSTYFPVPARVGVEEHPVDTRNTSALKNVEQYFQLFHVHLLNQNLLIKITNLL